MLAKRMGSTEESGVGGKANAHAADSRYGEGNQSSDGHGLIGHGGLGSINCATGPYYPECWPNHTEPKRSVDGDVESRSMTQAERISYLFQLYEKVQYHNCGVSSAEILRRIAEELRIGTQISNKA